MVKTLSKLDKPAKVVCFMVLVLGFSGCATIKENLDSGSQQLQDRIDYLERQLQKQQEKNFSLIEELTEARKEIESFSIKGFNRETGFQIRMPTAREIQTALNNAGFYDGEIDGIIGTRTKEAISNFQIANDLNPDGVVGSRTWAILVKYLKEEE